ncbi:MAG: GNAT family N-acetyltransferase [Pseudomonadota bacterium]
MNSPAPDITDNPSAHRYELRVDGEVAAHCEYNVLKDALLFTHTEVLPRFEGKGLASRLIAFALDDVRQRGLHAIPVCPFVAGFIRKHPEYLDLVSEESRRAFLR